jgi:hypothetical protein
MSENSKKAKIDFIRAILTHADSVSANSEAAGQYLLSEGLNVEAIKEEGLKRIKKLRLRIEADKTRSEMESSERHKQKAIEWVNDLLSDINFSFSEFIKKEKLVLQNRNLESLTEEDIRNTLIQYYTLKFLDEDTDKNK